MFIYKSIQKDDCIYSIEIQLSSYKFTVFPLIYIALYNKGFKVILGLFSFFIEIAKISNYNHKEALNLLKFLSKNDTRR